MAVWLSALLFISSVLVMRTFHLHQWCFWHKNFGDSQNRSFFFSLLLFLSHYMIHGGWMEEEGFLLNHVDSIRHIPATVVNGRYDMVTPIKTAWELHKVRCLAVEYGVCQHVNCVCACARVCTRVLAWPKSGGW